MDTLMGTYRKYDMSGRLISETTELPEVKPPQKEYASLDRQLYNEAWELTERKEEREK